MCDLVLNIQYILNFVIGQKSFGLTGNFTLSPDTEYVNRKQDNQNILLKMHDALKNSSCVALVAAGGMGKSTCAREYYKWLIRRKSTVWWITAESISDIIADIKIILLIDFKVSEKAIEGDNTAEKHSSAYKITAYKLFFRHIQLLAPKNYYLVLDNVNEAEDIDPFLTCKPPNLKVIITTRKSQINSKGINIIELKGMSREEGLECLKRYLKMTKHAHFDEIVVKVVDILEQKGDLIPLSLRASATFVSKWRINSFDAIIKKFMEHTPVYDALYNSLFKAIAVSEEHKNEWDMFQYVAFLLPDYIPIDLLNQILGRDLDSDNVAAWCVLEIVCNENTSFCRIHRLFQDAIQKVLTSERKLEICEKIGQTLNKLFPETGRIPSASWESAKIFAQQVKHLIDYIEDKKVNISSVYELYEKMGQYHQHVILWRKEAHKWYKRALKMGESSESVTTKQKASMLIQIGENYKERGRFNKAIECNEHALKLLREDQINNTPEISRALTNLGLAYYNLGNYQKAIEYHEESLNMDKIKV